MAKAPAKPAKAGGSNQERVSIKRISNGYLTVRSGLKDGKPFRDERFSRQQPVASVAVPKRAPAAEAKRPHLVGGNEVGYLKRGGI